MSDVTIIQERDAGGRHFVELLKLSGGSVWETLVSDPGIGVAVVTEEGKTLWCNDQAAKIFRGQAGKASDFVGKKWSELMPAEWVTERLDLLTTMKRTGEPILMRSIWDGRQHVSWIRPIEENENDPEGPMRFMVILRRIDSAQLDEDLASRPETEFVESGVANLGALGELTTRELEVLALIGQALSTKEIAQLLHRSEKTIDGHRQSLGKKLGAASRLELAEIARQAGLMLQDAGKKRV